MRTGRGRWVVGALGVLLLAACALEVRAEDGKASDAVDWTARAKQVWASNCSKCHAPPDVRFETDRGFLAQITETS